MLSTTRSIYSPERRPWTSPGGIWTKKSPQQLRCPTQRQAKSYTTVRQTRGNRSKHRYLSKSVALGWLTGECGRGGTCQSGLSCCWGWSWHFQNSPRLERLPLAAQPGREVNQRQKNKGGQIKQPGLTKTTLPSRHKKHIDKVATARKLPDAGCHFCPDTWNWGSGLSAW